MARTTIRLCIIKKEKSTGSATEQNTREQTREKFLFILLYKNDGGALILKITPKSYQDYHLNFKYILDTASMKSRIFIYFYLNCYL